MVWRSVVISQPAKLKREHFSLVVEQEQAARVPFEDIAVIVLNHREITLTHPVLSACGEYGIGLFSTGDNHQPNGVFTAFLSHSRATKMLRLQLGIDKPSSKRAWTEIIRAKILNQAACLKLSERAMDEKSWNRLEAFARHVRSGDIDNVEAKAGAYYFPKLFGSSFDRSQEGWINAALDYGYAVLRGTIARGLVAHGLLPSLGLFHRSEQNAFNLADDLIEPFRPIVDLHVSRNVSLAAKDGAQLLPTDKGALVALLNVDVGMPRGEMSALAAIDQATASLARIYEGADTPLELPRLIGLRQHLIEA